MEDRMMDYVTYNEAGELTGSYSQSLHPTHVQCHIEVSADLRAAWTSYRANAARNGLELLPPAPTTPTVRAYTDAVQAHLDAAARAHHYDNIVSACSYAGAPNPFQAEGAAFVTWRGAVWASCYVTMADVQAGTRAAPTIAELIAELPALAL